MVSENKVLEKIFGPKRLEETKSEVKSIIPILVGKHEESILPYTSVY